MTAATV